MSFINKAIPKLPNTFEQSEINKMDKVARLGGLTCLAGISLTGFGAYMIYRTKRETNPRKVDYLIGASIISVGVPLAVVSYNTRSLATNLQTFARNESKFSLGPEEVLRRNSLYEKEALLALLQKRTVGCGRVCNFTVDILTAKKAKKIANADLFQVTRRLNQVHGRIEVIAV